MGMNSSSSNGEIIEVEGGHIVRSTNRKDRHSKVYTSKGPRDRRVRLSAHTAIEFYDVQDRLGYDRPSKAVDWLITKAKSAIDNLAELPPPPTASHAENAAGHADMPMGESSEYRFQGQLPSALNGFGADSFSILSHSAAGQLKQTAPKCSPDADPVDFQGLMSKTAHEEEDLCLSLHPFEDPSNQDGPHDQNLFAGPASMRFHRMLGWENGGSGFVYNNSPSPSPNPSLPQFIGSSSQFSHQRGPLQSSFPIASVSSDQYRKQLAHHHSSMAEEYPGFAHPADSQPQRAWEGSSR